MILINNLIIYWIIRTIVFITFIVTGYWISYKYEKIKNYWMACLPCIVIYSLAEGLRWGRESDFFHYYNDLTSQLFTNYSETIYVFWISMFKSSGLPYWIGFVFYSFLLIFSFLYLIKRIPKIAVYSLPLFLIITSIQSENLIRQFFALAFIIFALAFYFDRKHVLMILSAIVAMKIHFSAVFPVLVLILSYILTKRYTPKKPILLVCVFLFFFFLWNATYFSTISDALIKYMPDTGTQMDGYVQSASWFNADGSQALKYGGKKWAGASLVNMLIRFLVYLFIVIAGFFATKKDNHLRLCFFCTYFAILIECIKGDIEGYIRLYHWLAFMISIIVGVIYTQQNLSNNIKKVSYVVLSVYFIYMLFYSRMFVLEPWGYSFIWDK